MKKERANKLEVGGSGLVRPVACCLELIGLEVEMLLVLVMVFLAAGDIEATSSPVVPPGTMVPTLGT